MGNMPDERSRYGRDRLNAFQLHIAESAEKHAFTFRPWKLGGLRLTDEQLVSHVEEELAEHGFWTDYGEMVMGAGMQARVDLVESDGAAAYRVTGGFGVTIQGTYRDLGRALDMAALFSSLEWDITVADGWRDSSLIFPSEEPAP
jgi:hypothetical protein